MSSKTKFINEVNGKLHTIIMTYLKFGKDNSGNMELQKIRFNECRRNWIGFIHSKRIMKLAAKYGHGFYPEAFNKGVIVYEQNKITPE